MVTTKIYSKKIENKPYKNDVVNIKNSLPTISMAKLTNVGNATNGGAAKVANTKRSSSPAINSTLPSQKTSNTTTSTSTESSAANTSTTSNPTEGEMKELDEESFYVTSNYYVRQLF